MRSVGLVFAIVAIAAACKGKQEGDPTKVTVESKDDATEPIVDENYRFKITWPGKGWKLMRTHDASKMVTDAVAGATFDDSLFGGVIVEAAPGLKLDAFVDLIVDSAITLANKKVVKRDPLVFAGVDAVRVVVTGSLEGQAITYIDTIFISQGYGYQVLGFGRSTDVADVGAKLQPFFDGFSLLPGKVSGRPTEPIVSEADGVGWRVRGGVFESAVTGIRVRPTDTWRISVAASLQKLNADAEVGIVHSNPDVYIVLIVERAPPEAGRAEFLTQLRSAIATDAERGKPIAATFAGKPLELVPFTQTGAMPTEHLHGVHYVGDQIVQVMAWYLAPDRERARKSLQDGLALADFLPEPARTKLLAELERAPDTQSAVGPAYSLRRGVYRSFEHGFTWTKPATSMWRITAGDAAKADGAEVKFDEPARNLYGSITVVDNPGEPEAFHASQVAAFEGTKSAPVTFALGTATARVTTLDTTFQGQPMRYSILTTAAGNTGIQMMVWGARTDLKQHAGAVDAALRGFRFSTTPAIEKDGEHRDHRLGFAVKVPASYRFTDAATAQQSADRSVVIWERGSAGLGAFAIHMSISDENWLFGYVEQMVRDQLGKFVTGTATRTELTIDGRRVRRLVWSQLELHMMVRDEVVYAYFNTPNAPGIEAFRLLD